MGMEDGLIERRTSAPGRILPRVSTEMSLHVLACNLKRAMAILGTRSLIAAVRA